jgi:paraquat-inducible protein A
MPENPVACADCDLLQNVPLLPPRGKALCCRCGKVLATNKPVANERTLALAIGAAIVFVIANAFPLMGLSAAGREFDTTIIGGAWAMWQEGHQLTAALVGLCAVVAPAGYIVITIMVLIATRNHRSAPSWVGDLLHWVELAREWAMAEVMMLGILVAMIKIADFATVIIGVGMFATGALILLLTAMTINFDPEEIWTQVQWNAGGVRTHSKSPPNYGLPRGREVSAPREPMAMPSGIALCKHCGLLSKLTATHETSYCSRCSNKLAFRRHEAIQRTWALIIAAAICYIPANIFPVMTSVTIVGAHEDTIIDGVILLYLTGSWHLALIVLIASVMIPVAKLFALAYLLITVQRRSLKSNRERVQLYRLVEFIGRWSMLDVFVIAFVVALVQLKPLMAAQPRAGVLFFAAVVVLTIFASQSFDPRLIWDSADSMENRND